MNIGFDLDRIFINTPPFIPASIIERLYKKKDNGILLYRIPKYPEQLFRKATHLPFFRQPIQENLEILKEISKEHHKLYLISSRYKFLEDSTKNIIEKYHLDKIFEKMYFNFENQQPHTFKNDIISKLNLDLYIDDDLSLIKYVAKHNDKTKFYWLNDRQKNKSIEKNVFAISRLSELFKHESYL
jgi:hypothetical protein